MSERRYDEDEVAEIFRAAANARDPEPQPHALASVSGLSLAELQTIGGQVGIAPDRIADAAAAVELRRGAPPRRTYMGMPVSVGRVVELPRAPTDREWELLLTDLRETFGAHGRDRSQGGLRAWTNGNLHAYVEPKESGHRLRLGTMKSNAPVLGGLGIAGILLGLALTLMILTGIETGNVAGAIFVAVMGALALASNAVRLPRWADEREEQMERIAARARSLIRPEPLPAGT
jgi:hypothetical protein